jgi:hypothetical protein
MHRNRRAQAARPQAGSFACFRFLESDTLLQLMKYAVFLQILTLFIPWTLAALEAPPSQQVQIDFFYEEGCEECERVKQEVIPSLEAACSGQYDLHYRSTGVVSNYVLLVKYMDASGTNRNAHVYMVIDERVVLAGFEEIAEQLLPRVTDRLVQGAERTTPPPPLPAAPADETAMLSQRAQSFTMAGVALAGLVDGINPCAISTLVFLISVLTMAKARGAHVLRVGIAFCLASFITYTAIGFGLLRALHALSAFQTVRNALEIAMVLCLLALAFLSFRDAFRFRSTGKAADITLQLPDRIKGTIHGLLRTGIGQRAQVASGFAVGALVTALESVCTGQMYVPTLVVVVKSGANVAQGLALLVLYNVMFVLPLAATLVLSWRGLRLEKLIQWSVRNVFISKLLLGLFFLLLAATLVMLK